MGKWKKQAFAFGLASSLLVPSVASASVNGEVSGKEKPEYNLLERLNISSKERSKLFYEQKQKDMQQYSDNTLVVKYNKKISSADHRKVGGQVIRSYPEFGYEVIRLQKGRKMEDALKAYRHISGVASVSPSVELQLFGNQGDPKEKDMYHLSSLEIDKAIAMAGKNDVTVAVIDEGVDPNHPEFKGRISSPVSIADPANPAPPGPHGTHVAGIIGAAENNGVGGHGINPKAKIMSISVFDQFSGDYVLADAILYAVEHGADVINMSLGAYVEMPLVEEAVKKAVDKGVVVVAAAGNSADMTYQYPAAYDGVITVGSTNAEKKKSWYSTYGPVIDVAAPGEDVYSSLYAPVKGSTFGKMSGTSMSSPVVAGIASLIKSKYPNLNSYQVEAILEKTATDLGDKGFDLDYGHGLVNPVAALNFDPKNLPTYKDQTDSEILAAAEAVTISEEGTTRTGSITKPRQTDWIKVSVEEGEYIQSILSGAKNYDQQLKVKFYSESGQAEKTIEVKQGRQNELEAYLFKAPANGTLVIGVTDENENYSESGESMYELKLMKANEASDELGTKEEPIQIEKLPFNSNDLEGAPLTLLNDEEADKDYYKFKFDEPTNVSFTLSSVPGLDTELKIYPADMLSQEPPADLPDWEKEFWPYPEVWGNNNGFSKGEAVSFEAMPEMEYVLEVSAGATAYNDFMIFFGPMIEQSVEEEKKQVVGSLLPYELKAETKELPEDEDGYPQEEAMPEELEEMMEEEQAQQESRAEMLKNRTYKTSPYDFSLLGGGMWFDMSKEEFQKIKEAARPFTLGEGQTGYFQTPMDQDWYQFEVGESAIYELAMNQTDTLRPDMTLFAYDNKEDNIYPVYSSWMSYNPLTGEGQTEAKMTLYLEKGQKYYLNTANMNGMSFDEYKLGGKKVKNAPVDSNENNDTMIRAKALSAGSKVKGNFIKPGDIDMFYYKHRSNEMLFGFHLNPLKTTEEQKAGLPMELTLPLDPIVSVVEDTNGNMKMDNNEMSNFVIFDHGWDSEPEAGSFKAKKDVGYFMIVENWLGSSVSEYELALNALNTKDEDAASKVTNNVPSKPLALKAVNAKKWEAKALLNPGVPFGDKDFYQFNTAAAGQYTFTLQTPEELDGVITIYDAKGKEVAKLDQYYIGDAEIGAVQLAKGNYFIEVKDANVRSSNNPYTLTVETK
ncbi:S8 family peptidase [Priestia abyssalis]|uniref:S8 family peptidase n=1 Tax=Priestia abyssalis TaxID=1221450 RepID=UPI000994E7E6|nr:S8 family serine peptidase [Priestia abyssalis]